MPRRTIRRLVTLALGLLVAPLIAAAPLGKVWRIGLFHVGLDHVPPWLEVLREELHRFGYEEGKNLHWDWRNLPDEAAARETAHAFVREHVDLIVAFENQTVRAAQAATAEIPVVFMGASDPVAAGFVHSLAHPGGNLTGFEAFTLELPDKKLELFKAIVPHLRRVLVLQDPADPLTRSLLAELRTAGAALKLQLVEQTVTTQADIERVFGALSRGDVDGVYVLSPDLLVKFSALVIRLATERGLPVPGHRKEWVRQGALFSYAPDSRADAREAAVYIDKILHGTKPADLPVERPMAFELVINLKTAQALGITIPPPLLFQADEVIR
jgi:putative tryptophan/tyrosine transport system substrate-binding protein